LKEIADKLPPEVSDTENFKTMLTRAEDFLKENLESKTSSSPSNSECEQQNAPALNSCSSKLQEHKIEETNEAAGVDSSQDGGNVLQESDKSSLSNNEVVVHPQSSENDSKSLESSRSRREGETQVIEQFEPGVYVTLIVKPGGIKVFKRVRFSKRRFHEHQAEEWWNKNKDRVLRKYSPQATNPESTVPGIPPPSDENCEADLS
ncbi:Brevis radix, partial [Sesbania bispinosa]